jgi:hypothetical protein
MEIIESDAEFAHFVEKCSKFDWIAIPIYCNGDRPVYVDSVSLLYVYTLHLDEDFIIVLNHTEGANLPDTILNNLPEDNKLFVYNKKRFKQFCKNKNLIDINLIEWTQRNRPIDDDFDTSAHEFYIKNFSKFNNLNCIIPISKHTEKCQAIVDRFLDVYDYYQQDESFAVYNDLFIENLFQIEQNGLFTSFDTFKTKFPLTKIYDGFSYTDYNIYTTTGRPSNRFDGINFAALNKEDGSRAAFVSRFGENGFMMSFDYDAYHLRLLAELVDYSFPVNCSVHEYLGKFYFDKSELTRDEYNEAKSISFRQLYGGIGKEYLEIPFFEKVYEYTKLLWEQYSDNGYIETPMFSRKLFHSFFTNMNSAKLLNYLLQAFETERNMAVIHNVLLRTQSFKSKLILYTYDSFLFDFNKNDGAEFIQIITSELEQNGKFPTKVEIGPDYNNLISVKIPK